MAVTLIEIIELLKGACADKLLVARNYTRAELNASSVRCSTPRGSGMSLNF